MYMSKKYLRRPAFVTSLSARLNCIKSNIVILVIVHNIYLTDSVLDVLAYFTTMPHVRSIQIYTTMQKHSWYNNNIVLYVVRPTIHLYN